MEHQMKDVDVMDKIKLLSKTKQKQLIWPEPMVIKPLNGVHTHSFILLHGRGSNAERFGTQLMKATTSFTSSTCTSWTLDDHFPSAQFIFPTAKKRRSTKLKRVLINQWFDNYSLEDPSTRQELQYDGLVETNVFLRKLIDREAQAVGYSNVIIGGLSQGCASALHVMLTVKSGDTEGCQQIAAFVGMSGWLPFANVLDPRSSIRGLNDGDGYLGKSAEDDMFTWTTDAEEMFSAEDEADDEDNASDEGDDDDEGKPDSEVGTGDVYDAAIKHDEEKSDNHHEAQLDMTNTARDIASLPCLGDNELPSFPVVPIFLGHGRNDDKISVRLGEEAKDILEAAGCKVKWCTYDEGHWYKVPEEIDDIVQFLQNDVGIPGQPI